MQANSQTESASLSTGNGDSGHSHGAEDLVYETWTIAAILLLLGSLWVF